MSTTKKFLIFISIGIATLLLGACGKFVEGYHVDPNNPAEVPESLLLPQAQVSLGSMLGEDLTWYSQVFMQNFYGTARQMNAAYKYDVNASDVGNAWLGIYAGHMEDFRIIIEQADENGNLHYSGPAKILMALSLGVSTDSWGNIPWTEALQGGENLKPVFENSRDVIYPEIMRLLNEGIADCGGQSKVSPGSDDLIFQGDMDKWIAAANALKARYANHLSNVDAIGSAMDALSAASSAMTSIQGDMMLPYGEADPREANPWYQFNEQRGDLVLDVQFVEYLKSKNDPRLPFYATTDVNGGYSGANPANPVLTGSQLGDAYGLINSSLPIITFSELKFIEAEAYLRQNQASDALEDYRNAIEASLLKITGAVDSTYMADYVPTNAADLTLEMIIMEKYVALFTQYESWVDQRRTGIPNLIPIAGNTLPGRYPYPQNERNANPNIPAVLGNGIFDMLWWAK